jgi:hypothetical protein
VPLDFVSWHIYNSDPQAIRKTVDYVKNLLKEFPALHCETILDEWNMSLSNPRLEPGYQPSFTIDTIYQMREAGLDYSAYYHIRDYHVSQERFSRFMTRPGTINMVNWWNFMPQFDGLFDYQGTMRPNYFAFKVLSQLRGDRLDAQIDAPVVKAMAAYDPEQDMIHAVVWNFAVETPPDRSVRLVIRNLQSKRCLLRRFLLDTATASNQENDRMWPMRTESFDAVGEITDSFDLAAYGVTLIALRNLGGRR